MSARISAWWTYRKLLRAGVDATGTTLHGVCHVADLMLRAGIGCAT